MTRTGLPVVVAIALLAMVAVARVEAQQSQFQASGTFHARGTSIDTNGDGRTADLIILNGSSSLLGALTSEAVVEWAVGAPTIACPAGTVLEGTLVLTGSAVVARAANGDLLFGEFTAGTSCTSATGIASISATGIFTGGTGVFATRTGNFALTAAATSLVEAPRFVGDPVIRALFGGLVVTVDGTLEPPPSPEPPPLPALR